ncbi:hypothetical protein KC19_3G029700 [Ceratodon purpureus]|uniref:F-box domain-containing protein n=1 Tax=Ceratodon purpureus TaxID=3225 RepID=A0A8T0IHL7_CERPU|nr:hypothetical protein KC19_3G029700 [Ceratodon purpureus]
MWKVLPTHLPLYSKQCTLLPTKAVTPLWEADVMDPEIWSELPDHIIYKILALLPLRDFLRLRWACRRWSRLIESPVFLDEFSQAKVERPWFAIVAEARKVYVYQPHSEKWYNMPASFLQPNSIFLATSKGLILSRFSRRASGLHDLLVVSNPFTGSQRILPRQILVGCGYAMVVDEATKAYTVYHFGQLEPFLDGLVANPHDHTLEAFSSTTNSWQVLCRINHDIFAGLPSYAFDDTKLLVWDDYIICRLRGYFGVFAYSLTRRDWLQIPWAVRPSICAFQQLLCSRDSLVMVVGIKKNMAADSGCESIHVHQLPRGTLDWSEVAVVPEYMNVMRYNFDSYGLGDFIFMLFAAKLLVFDTTYGTWSFAPHCDHICKNLQEFCFEPRLNTTA